MNKISDEAKKYAIKIWNPENHDDFLKTRKALRTIDDFTAGAEWGENQSRQQGMKWVCAKDRLPEERKRVITRWHSSKGGPYIEIFDADDISRWETAGHFGPDDISDIFWLDESAESLPVPADDRLKEALKKIRPYLAAQGTNGNHWIDIIDAALNPSTNPTAKTNQNEK